MSNSIIKKLREKGTLYVAIFILFITECLPMFVYADNWKSINNKKNISIPPLNLSEPCSEHSSFNSYFDFYKLNVPGIKHYFGSFESNGYTIAANIFVPEKYKASVFLLHGYFDHAGILKDIIHFLVQKGLAVAAYDMPGHGLSSGERASIDNFKIYADILNDFVSLYKTKFTGPLHVIAHSTGCAVVMEFILTTDSPLFEKIIFIAPLVRSYAWYLSKTGLFLCNPFCDSVPRIFGKNSSNPDFLQFIKEKDSLQYRKVPFQWVKSLFKWNESFQDYGTSSKNLLVIQGSLDKTVAWKYNLKKIKEKFPKAEVKIIKNGRHHLLNENSEMQKNIFNQILAYLMSIHK